MKTLWSYAIFAVSCGLLSAWCGAAETNEAKAGKPARRPPPKEEELAQFVRVGMTKDEVLKTFGTNYMAMDRDGFTTWLYWFAVDEENAPSFFISGVSITIKDNKVTHWGPNYRSIDRSVYLPVNPGKRSGKIEPVTFWLVSTNKIEGGRYIDTITLPKLGFIAAKPDLSIRRLKELEEAKGDRPNFRLTLTDEDAAAFHELTRKNVQKELLVMVGDEPLIAPRILVPIEQGVVTIPCENPEQCAQLRKKLAELLPSQHSARPERPK